MLRTLLLLTLGTFLTSGWKLVSVPLEEQGCSNSQKNLVCAEKSGNYQIFMNECYFQNASKTNTYIQTDPKNCNYFKDYVYIEFPTCAEVIQNANDQKLVYKQSYNSLIAVIENDFERFLQIPGSHYSSVFSTIRYYRQQISILNQMKDDFNTQSSEENKLTWPTNCGICTGDYVDTYEMCIDKELQNFNEEMIKLEEEWDSLKYKYLDITEGKFYLDGLYVIIKKITSVQAEEYLVNSIENLNTKNSKQMDILRNSTIPNDVYTTGQMIIDYLRICRNNTENVFVVDSVDRLIYAVEGLIQPFDSFRYTNLEPLMTFSPLRENAFYENMFTIDGYAYVFSLHNIYFSALKDKNSISLATLAWYRTILYDVSRVSRFLPYANAYVSLIMELISCLTQVHSDFNSVTPENVSIFQNIVSRCYSDYKMFKLCLDEQYGYAVSNLKNSTEIEERCITQELYHFYRAEIDCCY